MCRPAAGYLPRSRARRQRDRGRARSGCDPGRQRLDPAQEVRVGPHGGSDHLDPEVAPQDLLPQYLQLQLRQAIADAAMDARPEGQVVPWPGPVDDEAIRIVDDLLV